ncbi:hypothetical protein Patl1_12234 [Pistacia atlantica]|uniref:Uncharacterized protein n=1 Tax=Pistacia atlantica TaxID=434234 RepID=A0ACC1A7H7_9ROSI|nr:hypothetical protein Patl1_12234 [Pistacia atlantica]
MWVICFCCWNLLAGKKKLQNGWLGFDLLVFGLCGLLGWCESLDDWVTW